MAKDKLSDNRYTPRKYLISVRKVLGTIDLDPFSSTNANQIVKAESFFTKENSAFNHEWIGKVFSNPPYSRGMLQKAIDYALLQYEKRNMTEGIFLVPNWTERQWFQDLLMEHLPICFTDHRIDFVDGNILKPDGTCARKLMENPEAGSCFVYFGVNIKKFQVEFANYGTVINVNDHLHIPSEHAHLNFEVSDALSKLLR